MVVRRSGMTDREIPSCETPVWSLLHNPRIEAEPTPIHTSSQRLHENRNLPIRTDSVRNKGDERENSQS